MTSSLAIYLWETARSGGVLSSRVFMDVDDLKILRDEINAIVESVKPGGSEVD